jgi:hypothetical protein
MGENNAERSGKYIPGPALTYRFGSSPGIGLVRFVPWPRCRKFTTMAHAENVSVVWKRE